ncbi:hypothetical protein ACFL0V_05495 [Nanoarchaeota archaeon]
MKITTSRKELLDLLKALVAIGIAFAIVMQGIPTDPTFIIAFLFSILTVGIGFIGHELAHKILAQKYHCRAEFRSDDKMLLLAVIFSLFGFVFAAPGAVMIRGHLSKKQYGRVAAVGPATNIVISIAFLALFFSSIPLFKIIGSYGFRINAWLALFNMIPIGIFDGAKIWKYNRPAYIVIAAFALGLIILQNII